MPTRSTEPVPAEAKTEEWRAIAQYPGFEASTWARIRRTRDGKILTPTKGRGWVRQIVFREYKCSRSLHRLIATSYLGLCAKGHTVHFKDGNKLNCVPDNLSYGPPATPRRSTTPTTKAGTTKAGVAHTVQQHADTIWQSIAPETEHMLRSLFSD